MANLFGLEMRTTQELELGAWSFQFNAGYYLCALIMLVSFNLAIRIFRSPFGMMLRAVETNRTLTNYTGVNARPYTFAAFVVSGMHAELAGGCRLRWTRSPAPSGCSGRRRARSGGAGTLLGPVLEAGFIKYFESIFSKISDSVLHSWLAFMPDGLENLMVTLVHPVCRQGLAPDAGPDVFQTPEIFGDLTVIANVLIPCFARRDGAFRMHAFESVQNESSLTERGEQDLVDVGMIDKCDVHAAAMSSGDKRRLEMAMCLVQEPKLLQLDEPTAGMARADADNTIDLLEKIKAHCDLTRVITEHDMHVVFSLADRITVLAQATPLVEDAPDRIRGQPGRGRHTSARSTRRPAGYCMMTTAPFDPNANHAATAPAFLSVWNIDAGSTLSGGEQQLLAIARALARDIKVLLLDEPYEWLAPVIVQEITRILNIIRA